MSKKYLAACGKPWEDFLSYEHGGKLHKPRRWNPIKGCRRLEAGEACHAPDGQAYCYMKSFIERFGHLEAGFSFCEDEFNRLTDSGKIIAFGTAGDPWSYADTQSGMDALVQVLDRMAKLRTNLYVILTKHPAGLAQALAAAAYCPARIKHFLIGLTLDGMDPAEDLNRLAAFHKINAEKFIMFEPCFYQRRADFEEVFAYLDPGDWVVIGNLRDKDRRRVEKYKLPPETLDLICEFAERNNNPVFFKESVDDPACRVQNTKHSIFGTWQYSVNKTEEVEW